MLQAGSFETSQGPGIAVADRGATDWLEAQPRVSRAFFDFEVNRREAMRHPQIYLNFARGLLNICPGLELYAAEAVRAYAALRPRDAGGYVLLGTIYARLGALRDAAAAYERALQLEPGNEGAASALIYIYLLLEAYTKARHKAVMDA